MSETHDLKRQIEAGLKQLMADAFAAKLTATDAADVAYVAGLQNGIDIITAALASPSTLEPLPSLPALSPDQPTEAR